MRLRSIFVLRAQAGGSAGGSFRPGILGSFGRRRSGCGSAGAPESFSSGTVQGVVRCGVSSERGPAAGVRPLIPASREFHDGSPMGHNPHATFARPDARKSVRSGRHSREGAEQRISPALRSAQTSSGRTAARTAGASSGPSRARSCADRGPRLLTSPATKGQCSLCSSARP